jgi:hypothetical protein
MKGDIRIKKITKDGADMFTFDPRLSQDKKTFVLVIECTKKMSWYEAIMACVIYAKDEKDALLKETSLTEH